jgi:adenylate cyclase
MHVLVRGDVLQRLRLASGLVLLVFVATHFLNHALGLISLEAMQEMQAWRKLVTRSWLGSGVLLAAFLVHIALALYKISRRLTWKMPLWEAAQVLTGLSIPLLLITHVSYNRGAATLFGTDDTYTYELSNLWPGLAWQQAALLLIVWVHGCIGFHYWLRLTPAYARVRPVLFAAAVALPVSSLAGFSVAGRQVAATMEAPDARTALHATARAPDASGGAQLTALHDGLQVGFLALLALAVLVPIVRSLHRAAGAKVAVTYRGGPVVRAPLGPTLLEISRMRDVAHASVCGGRARCSTCRVGVDSGLDGLAPPTAAEAATLASIMAPPHVRLACQIRPHEPITVTRLVDAGTIKGASPGAQGVERTLAVLFFDTRGFTMISETRLPYDVVFILNRLFAEVGEAIKRHGGLIDKYMGDGLMAVFGNDVGPEAGCRQALRAACDIDIALDRLNHEIRSEIGHPLRIGLGLDVGPLVVGHIGHADTASVTVIGNTVNAASRFEALTKEKGCQLIVTADVLTCAGVNLEGFPREEVTVRGLSASRTILLISRARELADIAELVPTL